MTPPIDASPSFLPAGTVEGAGNASSLQKRRRTIATSLKTIIFVLIPQFLPVGGGYPFFPCRLAVSAERVRVEEVICM